MPTDPKLRRLHDIYRRIPTVHCKGKCAEACGAIDMTEVERKHIRDTHGVDIPRGTAADGPHVCPALGMFGQCTVYENRPLICRLYGAVKGPLECGYGCEIEGQPLDDKEGLHAIADAYVATGEWPAEHGEKVKAAVDTADTASLYRHVAKLRGELPARYGPRVAAGWNSLRQLMGDADGQAA